jgi:hypothetical protein
MDTGQTTKGRGAQAGGSLAVAPFRCVARPSNIGVRLQYQLANEWCWIAAATMINHYYNASSSVTQCSLMTTVGQTINHFPANTSACPSAPYLNQNPSVKASMNDPYSKSSLYALDNFLAGGPYNKTGGVGDPLNVNNNCANYPGQSSLSYSQIESEISAGHPIAVDIEWSDGTGNQHCPVIAGALNGYLFFCDAIYGDHMCAYADFPANYPPGAATVVAWVLTQPGN